MSRIYKLIMVALVAASFLVAGSAFAQSGPTMSGDVAMGFGTYTEAISQAPGGTAPDIEGYTTALENNLLAQGNNGPLNYRFRLRMRGTETPEEAGGSGDSTGGGQLQAVRAYIGYAVTDAFKITIRKAATSPVASVAENDPVQNLSYAFSGDMGDKVQIDFAFKAGAHTIGATLSPRTASAQTTNGSAQVSGGNNGVADHENLNMEVYGKLKFGAIAVDVKANTASGSDYGATSPASFDASGLQAHVIAPVGPAKISFDYETNTSDLRGSSSTAPKGELNFDYIGLKVEVAGIVFGYGQEVEERAGSTGVLGSGSDTETHINVHYRIPAGKGGWVGPEFSTKTTTKDTPGNTDSDKEQTTLRWLQVITF